MFLVMCCCKLRYSLLSCIIIESMPQDKSGRVGCSMPALQEDTLGFANRLAAHRTTAKTRRAALANTPMATRDEGHNGCLFQANHTLRRFEHFRKHRLQHGMNLWHGGPVLGSLTPTFVIMAYSSSGQLSGFGRRSPARTARATSLSSLIS